MITIENELFIEGVSRAFGQFLATHPELGETLLDRMAELRCELLTPAEAAEMVGLTVETLRANYREYGFEKSTALGPNEPRYFRSQIVEAMRKEGKVIKGRAPRLEKTRAKLATTITQFPRRHAPTLPATSTTGKEVA